MSTEEQKEISPEREEKAATPHAPEDSQVDNPDAAAMSPPQGPPPAAGVVEGSPQNETADPPTAIDDAKDTTPEKTQEEIPAPSTTETHSIAKAAKGVRFNSEVVVAAMQFDEKDEAVQRRRGEERAVQEALTDPKGNQQYFFRAMGRNAPPKTEESSPSQDKKKKKKEKEKEAEKEDAGDTEANKEEDATAKSGLAGEVQPAEGATAAEAGSDITEQASPSKSSRSLKEKLKDFKYEADPNERLYWQGLVKIDDVHTRLKEREEKLAQEEIERHSAHKHEPSAATKALPPNPTFEDFLDNRDQRTNSKAKIWGKKLAKHNTDFMEDVTFKPKMGDKSKRLVEKMTKEQRYCDPIKGWESHFNDHVTKEARMSGKFDQHQITPVRVRTTQDHFEKLYQESAIRQAAQDIVSQAAHAEYSAVHFKPETHRSFQENCPFDDTSSCNSRSPAAVVDSLLGKGESAKRRIEELRRKSEEETYTFAPKTNKLSQKMVQSWSQREVTPRGERGGGIGGGGAYNNKSTAGARSVHDLSPAIIGVVDRTQQQKPKSKFDVDLFYSKMHRAASDRETKLREIEEKKKVDELAECTFRPRTMNYDPAIPPQGSAASYYSGSNYSTPRKGGSVRQGHSGPGGVSARSAQSQQRTPRTQRNQHQHQQQQQQHQSFDEAAPISSRSSRQAPSRRVEDQYRPAEGKDYVVDLVAVPRSSSPTTARTFLDEEGSTDLGALQQELMGVIAEWQNIDA